VLPVPRPDHAQAVAEMALAMREEVARRADPSGQPLAVRIGIDTGPVEAGVIGTAKFSYANDQPGRLRSAEHALTGPMNKQHSRQNSQAGTPTSV
jgi:hypothetical protein